MIDRPFEDLSVGERRRSRARTITEADVVSFCALSGDWFSLHSDVEFARRSRFGERIAHGALTFSVSTGLFPPGEGIVVAFYGVRDLRFRQPVKIGDTIHVDYEVAALTDRGQHGLVELRWEVGNQQEAVALVGHRQQHPGRAVRVRARRGVRTARRQAARSGVNTARAARGGAAGPGEARRREDEHEKAPRGCRAPAHFSAPDSASWTVPPTVMTSERRRSAKRLAVAAILVLLAPLGSQISALALTSALVPIN